MHDTLRIYADVIVRLKYVKLPCTCPARNVEIDGTEKRFVSLPTG